MSSMGVSSSMTNQPEWEMIYCTDYSRLERDKTGVYTEEMEIAQCVDESSEDEEEHKYEVYRLRLDRCKLVVFNDGTNNTYLVPFAYEDSWPHPVHRYDEWFHSDLSGVASSCGSTLAELRTALCSEDAKERAWAYEAIAGHHGYVNFDQYPLTMTKKELDERWE